MGTLGVWMHGTASKGSAMLVCRTACQWSAEDAGVTPRVSQGSVARQVLKETDKQFFNQRIPHAVINIEDEEVEIDFMSGSGIWPVDSSAPRMFDKATCNAFTPALDRLEELGSYVTRSEWTLTAPTLTKDVSNSCQSSGSVGVNDGVMTPAKKHRKSGRVMSALGSMVS